MSANDSRQAAASWLLLCGLGYLVLMAVITWLMVSARSSALAELSTEKSIGEWQKWRDDVKEQQNEPGPVARRVPKSDEPPGLVLMRDYFAVCLTGAIFFTSLLFWVLVWFVTGMLRTSTTTTT